MPALIAGGCGFIGLNVAEACLRRGDDVVLLDRNEPPPDARAALDALPGSWVYAPVDVTDAAAVERAFADHDIGEVFYGAAVTSGPDRERDHPEQVLGVNVLGLTHVIQTARRAGARRMINISSGSAYGDGGFAASGAEPPLDEHASRPLPNSIYSVSKLASEGICRRLAALSGFDVFSVRLSIVFGPWELDSGARDTLSAPMQVGILALEGREATVDRRDARDWTYSRHIADALLALMDAPTHAHDVYNLSSGRPSSLLDWGTALAAHFPGFSCRLADEGEAPTINLHGDDDRLVMSTSRLDDDIGHSIPTDIDATAADFAEWMKRYPHYWSG